MCEIFETKPSFENLMRNNTVFVFCDFHNISMNLQFNDIIIAIFVSHMMVVSLVAFFLDLTLSRDDDATRDDNNLKWWEKFNIYGSDV
jgi:hypothetical protein